MPASTVHELRRELKELGLTEKTPWRIVAELAFHVFNTLGGIWIFVVVDAWWLKAVALLWSTLGLLGVATNTHTSAHGATSDSKWVNRTLTYFGYPFMSMLSATYWHYKHNVIHHPQPNVVGEDADVDLGPYFALTADQYEASSGWLRRWYNLQWLFFPFALAANGFNVQQLGWRHLISHLMDLEKCTAEHWWDLLAMTLHIVAWLVIPCFFFDPLAVIGLYAVRIVLMGYAMFVTFAPAHFPHEAQACAQDQKNADYFLIQTVNTVNYKTGPLGRLLCSGVDYQIEHHLFPNLSHVHYRKIAAKVKEYCEANGYPYRSIPWWKAAWQSLTIMKNPKPVITDLESQRVPMKG